MNPTNIPHMCLTLIPHPHHHFTYFPSPLPTPSPTHLSYYHPHPLHHLYPPHPAGAPSRIGDGLGLRTETPALLLNLPNPLYGSVWGVGGTYLLIPPPLVPLSSSFPSPAASSHACTRLRLRLFEDLYHLLPAPQPPTTSQAVSPVAFASGVETDAGREGGKGVRDESSSNTSLNHHSVHVSIYEKEWVRDEKGTIASPFLPPTPLLAPVLPSTAAWY